MGADSSSGINNERPFLLADEKERIREQPAPIVRGADAASPVIDGQS